MHNAVRYKNCFIDPRVDEPRDGSGFTVQIFIAEDRGNETLDHVFHYPVDARFPTRDAAQASAIAQGKREIDRGL